MNWMQGVFLYIEKVWNWIYCFFSNLWCQGADFVMSLIEEIVSVLITALAIIPIPDVLMEFEWPDAGPFSHALVDLGIPQGLTILASAFMVRFLKGLIPLIRS